ncbi:MULTISPECIES: endoribonuclease MazF [Pantoea]|jgi:mRNA interferase MazF|uniref:Toxin MazF n=1 Tax=Pantoea latae TaxID=1964541 RepID=A0A1V9DNA4_9GAMM|nr:toxin MazF [Pantoea latae]
MQSVPDAGDILWLDFTPQAGHEQAGRRPALVMSPAIYNRIGMMVCVPLTTRIKGNPFEVPIAGAPANVALADQVRNLDWKARNAAPKGRATPQELEAVRVKARLLIG